MSEEKITSEVLATLLKKARYCARTGKFFYKRTPASEFANLQAANRWNTIHAGREVGRTHTSHAGKKYCVVQIGKTLYLVHRLVFFMFHGWLPEQVDHVDGDGLNNRKLNLEPANNTTNAMNRRRHCGRKLPTGVYLTRNGNYEAQIRVNKKLIYLGRFATSDEAGVARKDAEKKHGFHVNHGSVRPL